MAVHICDRWMIVAVMLVACMAVLSPVPAAAMEAGFSSASAAVLQVVSSIAASPSIRLSPQPSIPFSLQVPPPGTPTLTFDIDQRYQELEVGFGGAFTQAAGSQFVKLPAELQSELIAAYFHPTDGLGYNIGRVPINSCDYSQFTYSYDDTPDDFSLQHFDRNATVDGASIIPLIQAAQKLTGNQLLLFAAPWSPPSWMKNSEQMNGSSTPCLKDDPQVYRAWAQYFVEWLAVYEANNISFWGLVSRHTGYKPRCRCRLCSS